MAFIKEIAKYINDSNNYDLSKESLIIIFPNKRAALKLRTEFSRGDYKKNIWLPQMMSIQEAMCSWSGLQLLDNIDITFELIKIIGNLDSNDVYGLASQMLKDFDEIDQYAVDAKNLFQNTKDAKEIEMHFDENREIDKKYIEFFASLNDYYNSLRKVLLENQTGYYGLISRYIYELDDEKLNEIIGDRKIIFAGFNAMTKTEESIIVRLIKNNKATLLWDLDEYYFNDEKQEAGVFAREFFKRNSNLPLPQSPFLSKRLCEDKKKIDIIGASGAVIQTNALQLELYQESKTKDYGTDEAIILADEALLIPVLNSIPVDKDEKFKKLQVTMGFPYSKTIINQFIQQLFSLQNHIKSNDKGIYFWSLVRLLNSELLKVIFTKKELRVLFNWKKELINKSTYYITADEYKNLEEGSYLHRFLCDISKKWENTYDCISSIKKLLTTIHDKIEGFDNNFIGNQISIAGRIINKIEKLVKKYDQIIQIHHIEMLYRQSSSEMTINMKGQHDGLQIMGLLETRNLDFKTVHILSVNEGILPQSKNANSLIPFDLRKFYGLPTYTNKQAVYAYHFYRLLQNAENIKIYHNTLADGMGEGESSRFIKQILHEMPTKNKNVEILEKIYKSPTGNNHEIKEITVDKNNDEVYNKIINKLTSISESGRPSGLSPSSISCYLKCPLKFYLKHIEKIKDESPNELIQSNVIGSIIHRTFENLYKHFGNEEITQDIYKKVKEEHYNESLQEALSENNFPNGLPNTGFNHLSSKMMNKMIDNFFKHEENFLKEEKKTMKIIGLEENLYHSLDIPGYDIKVNLIGYADRIDQVTDHVDNKTIRIIDYKTGSVEKKDVVINKTELKEIPEKALQLLIYKYLYMKSDKYKENQVVEPGIFGLRKLSKGLFQLSNKTTSFKEDTLIEDCESMFISLFSEILDKDTPFKQTEKTENCKYCDFLELCKREPKNY